MIGVTSAYALARDGWSVRLIDSLPQIAMGASLGNGRQLSYSHTNALANPRMLPQIPGLLLGCNPAFRMGMRPELDFAIWLAQFLGNSSSAAYRRNTLKTLELAEQSRSAMGRLLEKHAIEFDRKKAGKLVLLHSEAASHAARKSMEMKQWAGSSQQMLSAAEACEIEPALAQSPKPIIGAVYSPDDETGDCSRFARELCKVLTEQYGLELITGRKVASIERALAGASVRLEDGETLEAHLVVVANGHRANDLLEPMGHRQPIEPMKGYSFTAPLGNSPPQVSITDSARRIVFTNLGDRMLVAGIAEMGRLDCAVDPERLASMVQSARASLPEAANYSEADEGWAGMRPMTPSSYPIIRMLEPGIAVNAGQGMLGWTLAMGSAERLAEVVAAA